LKKSPNMRLNIVDKKETRQHKQMYGMVLLTDHKLYKYFINNSSHSIHFL